jgi:hypothetical protein
MEQDVSVGSSHRPLSCGNRNLEILIFDRPLIVINVLSEAAKLDFFNTRNQIKNLKHQFLITGIN